MRTNLPVTQQKHVFPDHKTALSTTDTSRHLTNAHTAFFRTSGYSLEELPGQPHHTVRHPGMPAQAFANMWHSLKKGPSAAVEAARAGEAGRGFAVVVSRT